MIRCAIYDRVSTEMQAKDGLSLDAQKQALTDYALTHHYTIVDYYTDEGITARKKMQNRRDLLRLLEDVKADKIDLILVTKLDRWFRNIKDYHNTQAILEAHHCNWKTIFEEYDTSTSNGRFAINIMLSVNENECDRDSERIRSVFEYKKNNREYLSGRPAYGYLVDKHKHLVKNPATQPIVEEIFSHYFTTYSKKETIHYIQVKYGESAPTYHQILRILSSETYTGCLYGIPDYCEAYISPKQFHHLKSVSQTKDMYHQKEPYLFSSLIQCPVCGKNLSGFVKKNKGKDGTIRLSKRYRCCNKYAYHNGACLSEKTIENYLMEQLTQSPKNFPSKTLEKHLCQIQATTTTVALISEQFSTHKHKYITSHMQEELDRLNNLYLKGRITESCYEEKYAALQNVKNFSYIADFWDGCDSFSQACTDNAIQEQVSVPTTAKNWQEQYQILPILQKKAFWKSIVSTVYIDASTHKLCGCAFRSTPCSSIPSQV